MRAMRFIVCAAAVAAGACTSEPEIEVAANTQTLQSCPKNTCGDGNSPVIDGVYFWRLHAGGQANDEKVRIVNVHKGGLPLRLDVDGDSLRGLDPITENVLFEGTSLIGTRINVMVGDRPFTIRIASVTHTERFWVGAAKSVTPIWSYELRYAPFGMGPVDVEPALCSEGDGDPTKLHALVFEGELYNPRTKEIEQGTTTAGWFNIACVDSAIYKMHKIGHTRVAASRLGTPLPSIDHRRAMLNAWTAKVCEDGSSFTEQGVPIRLRDSLGLLPWTSPYFFAPAYTAPERIEAIWGPTGAVCLTTHRLDETPDPPDIPCRAALPACDALLGAWNTEGLVVTAVPPL